MEYIAIFAGGSVPFFLYLKKMKPHDEISLDFDWFYRKPLNSIILMISKFIYSVYDLCDRHAAAFAGYMRMHFGDPYMWTHNTGSVRIRKLSFENEDRLVGDLISVILAAFVILITGAAYIAG
jgi:multicomponent Na+:H+ antiporter subunit D